MEFYFENISGTNNILSLTKSNECAPTKELYYSLDGSSWTFWGTTTTDPMEIPMGAGQKVYLRGTNKAWANRLGYNLFSTTGDVNIGGDLTTLLVPAGNVQDISDLEYAFYNLFHGLTHLKGASALVLPSMTLGIRCYDNLFACCTSLTGAPALPATALASDCYSSMFSGCTSLVNAPELPATVLTGSCYQFMFNGCSSLNKVTTYAQTLSTYDCHGWLYEAASTGDFYSLGGAAYLTGVSGIPTGWTVHTTLE